MVFSVVWQNFCVRGRKKSHQEENGCMAYTFLWELTADSWNDRIGVTTLFQGVHDLTSPVVGSHSVGRSTSGRFCRVCLGTGDFLRPQGAITQAFTPLRGVYCLSPLIRGMPTGLKVILALPNACGLRPCDRTHLKSGLAPHSYVGGTYDKYKECSLWKFEFEFCLTAHQILWVI